jgi:hypothetical protein
MKIIPFSALYHTLEKYNFIDPLKRKQELYNNIVRGNHTYTTLFFIHISSNSTCVKHSNLKIHFSTNFTITKNPLAIHQIPIKNEKHPSGFNSVL